MACVEGARLVAIENDLEVTETSRRYAIVGLAALAVAILMVEVLILYGVDRLCARGGEVRAHQSRPQVVPVRPPWATILREGLPSDALNEGHVPAP